jgi:TM2 domain-containing membrane protein YozV
MSNDNRPIIIQQISAPQPKWNKGTAGVLSFVIPGLGQIYKGSFFSGIIWFVMTLLGYAAFIVPGVILHLICIMAAMSGNPNR